MLAKQIVGRVGTNWGELYDGMFGNETPFFLFSKMNAKRWVRVYTLNESGLWPTVEQWQPKALEDERGGWAMTGGGETQCLNRNECEYLAAVEIREWVA